jgi:3-oxoadipate enol-lactonase
MAFVHTRLGRWACDITTGSRTGPAFVLLHGLMLDRRTWSEQRDALAGLGTVVAFDGPGHGESDPPPPFDLDDHAEALADALDELGLERAVLLGHSWGAIAAMRFAARHPERTQALVVVGASAAPEPLFQRIEYELYVLLVRLAGIPRWFVRRRLAGIVFGRRACRERPELVEALHRSLRSHPRAGFLEAALAVIRRPAMADQLSRISAPTLVVCGREDRTMSAARTVEIARALPDASLAILEGCGHAPQLERADLFEPLLLGFVHGRATREAVA